MPLIIQFQLESEDEEEEVRTSSHHNNTTSYDDDVSCKSFQSVLLFFNQFHFLGRVLLSFELASPS